MVDLIKSREKIDEIDKKIVELLEERMGISKDVAEYKLQVGKKVYDRQRELEKLEVLRGLASTEFNSHAVEELFTQIMSISRKYQYSLLASYSKELEFQPLKQLHINKDTKVAYFGEPGSYTNQAMEEYFGEDMEGIAVTNFKRVMEMVKNRDVDYGVLPIENSSTGGITDIYDLLMEYDNTIIGEHVIKVEHALLGCPGAKKAAITSVYSHPQALSQCAKYFDSNVVLQQEKSTSSAAKKIAQEHDVTQGAIGSTRAAKQYGLDILDTCINVEEGNSTRFIIITNEKIYLEDADKVSICFELPHESGTLYNMLSHIMYNNLNMTKIESRPISGRTWEYRFFVEFEGNLQEAGVRNALNGIKEEATLLRILGNFR